MSVFQLKIFGQHFYPFDQAQYKPTEEVLPQVANKLEQERKNQTYISTQRFSNISHFQKRPRDQSPMIGQSTRRPVQKFRRRNTICSLMPKYEMKPPMSTNSPNDCYPTSACQDVTKVNKIKKKCFAKFSFIFAKISIFTFRKNFHLNSGFSKILCFQILRLYDYITDDQIMMDSCPTLIRLGIFRHLL